MAALIVLQIAASLKAGKPFVDDCENQRAVEKLITTVVIEKNSGNSIPQESLVEMLENVKNPNATVRFQHKGEILVTPLLAAAGVLSQYHLFSALLQKEFPVPLRPNFKDPYGWTTLHWLANYSGQSSSFFIRTISKLSGVHIDCKDCNGKTPLMLAALSPAEPSQKAEVFSHLVCLGANPHTVDLYGMSAHDYAEQCGILGEFEEFSYLPREIFD